MARTWTKIETAIVDHPKTWALARAWQTHPYMVVGFFVAFWGYLIEYHPDGNVDEVPDEVLERFAAPCTARALGVVGTVRDALRTTGWVDRDGRWHDWDDYSGALVRKRRANAERMKQERLTKSDRASHVQRTRAARARPRDKSLESRGSSSVPIGTGESSPASDPPWNAELALLLRQHLVPRHPADWSIERDLSICKAAIGKGIAVRELAAAIRGLPLVCSSGALTLRLLYAPSTGQMPLFQRAAHAGFTAMEKQRRRPGSREATPIATLLGEGGR